MNIDRLLAARTAAALAQSRPRTPHNLRVSTPELDGTADAQGEPDAPQIDYADYLHYMAQVTPRPSPPVEYAPMRAFEQPQSAVVFDPPFGHGFSSTNPSNIPTPPCAREILDWQYDARAQSLTHLWRAQDGKLYISTTIALPEPVRTL